VCADSATLAPQLARINGDEARPGVGGRYQTQTSTALAGNQNASGGAF
jgi:hypothetical protein